MEKEILLVGAKIVTKKENNQSYNIVEYVDFKNNVNKSLCKKVEEMDQKKYEHIKSKVIPHDVNKVTGIFEINAFDRVELVDVK